MLFETIAKTIAERTNRDISEIKMESTFSELGIEYPIFQGGMAWGVSTYR